jgi:hypothetical protein
MDYQSAMTSAIGAIQSRSTYGDVTDVHDDIAKTLTILMGKPFSMYDVAMVHHVTKLVRAKRDRQNPDHFVDGINYLAFAAQFSGANTVEQDIRDIAARFAPMPRTEPVDLTGGPAE